MYHGGDKYDSDDSEEFFLDTPENINDGMRNQSRPNGGDNNSVNMVDVTPKGNTASERLENEVLNHTAEEDSDTSITMTSHLVRIVRWEHIYGTIHTVPFGFLNRVILQARPKSYG